MIYATGDTHGNFKRFEPEFFPEQAEMGRDDYVIICGDYDEKIIIWKILEKLLKRRDFHLKTSG